MSGKVVPKGTRPLILPVAPLASAVDALRATRAVHSIITDPTTANSYLKAVTRGRISDALADRVCVRVLGRHPADVYGQAWWDAVADAPALREDVAS